MPLSEYVSAIRGMIGSRLLILPGVTAVIVDGAGRYLLARHVAGDRWGFVGGGIEPLEDPRAALRREVQEELGLQVDIVAVLDSYGGADLTNEYPNGDVVSYVTTAYLCRLAEQPPILEKAELSAVGWFFPPEIKQLDRFEWIDRVIDDIRPDLHRPDSAQKASFHAIT
ncbi:NUDIX domain-containing protein [Cryobacterium sp. MLB-32]|uniref:NUDIX domain-containing protein n=1 Tax=Cryobacterium sp. MLB-32 TaxID=1529318 RepID=UPI00068AB6C5|nr:NUDIX domain-containing protein [Cryobacterium sp. MLB-32]